jgi:hypothetical protein
MSASLISTLATLQSEPVRIKHQVRSAYPLRNESVPAEEHGASISAMAFFAFITGGMFGSFIGVLSMAVAWGTR